MEGFTLQKDERLCSQKLIGDLFTSGESFLSYPLKVVFLKTELSTTLPAQAAFTVSKRNFKRAVKRNLLKHCSTVKIVYNQDLKKFENKAEESKQDEQKPDSTINHPNPNVKVSTDHNGKAPVTVYEMPNLTRTTPVQPELQMEVLGNKNGRRLL